MFYIGVDPGAKGGIAVLNDEMCLAYPYSNKALKVVCETYAGESVVTVEYVHAMPGQGVSSTFTFGRNYGYILGVLEAFEMPYQTADAKTWKKYFRVSADKQTSIAKCKELYPGIKLKPTSKCRKESDGMAEAVLIGLYGKEKLWKEEGEK